MREDQLSPLAVAVRKLLNKKNADGSPHYGPAEVHALRAMILLELVRREAIDPLTSPYKVELALLFDGIGLNEHTDPQSVEAKVRHYFQSLNIRSSILLEFDRLLKRHRKVDDRMEAVAETERAFDRMMERDGQPRAPHVGDEVPKDARAAQDLAQSLGVKLRI